MQQLRKTQSQFTRLDQTTKYFSDKFLMLIFFSELKRFYSSLSSEKLFF